MLDRSNIVGASDVPILLGLSKYQTPFGLWLGKVQPGEREESAAMESGNALEDGIRRWVGKKINASLVVPGPTLDETPCIGKEPWMTARPDAFYTVDGVVYCGEIKKRRFSDGWGDQGEDIIPDDVRVQTVWQNLVTDLRGTHVGAYLLNVDELRTYFTPRDAEVEKIVVDKVGEWYARHLDPHGPRIAPDIDASPEAAKYLFGKYPEYRPTIRPATNEEVALAAEYARIKDEIKRLEEAEKRAANLLRECIGDAEGIEAIGVGKVTWRTVSGAERVDSKLLKSRFPDVWNAVQSKGEDRRDLRLWPAK